MKFEELRAIMMSTLSFGTAGGVIVCVDYSPLSNQVVVWCIHGFSLNKECNKQSFCCSLGAGSIGLEKIWPSAWKGYLATKMLRLAIKNTIYRFFFVGLLVQRISRKTAANSFLINSLNIFRCWEGFLLFSVWQNILYLLSFYSFCTSRSAI